MFPSTKISLRHSLFALCLGTSAFGAVACGGSAPAPKTPEASPDPVAVTQAPTTPTIATAPSLVMPAIPSDAVAAPASLMAELSLSNPNKQLTDMGIFADSVQPGIGAFISAQGMLQQLEVMVGVVGLGGVDLNSPLYGLMLDTERVVLVATVNDEEALRKSLSGVDSAFILHNGFVAIGDPVAMQEVAPYALSNLVAQKINTHPVFSLFPDMILKGKKGAELKSELRNNFGGIAAQQVTLGMDQISALRIAIATDQAGANVEVVADVKDGQLRRLIGKQEPAAYTNISKIGTGPWGVLAGGRLDLRMLSPMLVQLGERQANPLLVQVATQIGELVGEVAIGVNYPSKPKLAFAMDLTHPDATAKLIDVLMGLASKEKGLSMMDMKAKVKVNAIKNGSGKLHELKLTPTNDRQRDILGKRPVAAYWGVMGKSLIGTFGIDSKKNARTLSKPTGQMAGKGTKIAQAIELSKSKKESAMIALDVVGLQARRDFKDVTPVVLGIGFTSDQIRGRAVVPTDFIKELMSGF